MGKSLHKLSARSVQTLTKSGRHSDGGGLYLSISTDGTRKRWVFLYRWREPGQVGTGRLREMGLGTPSNVSLAKARELAAQARAHVAAGRDPLAARATTVSTPTFGTMAEDVISSLEAGWRNEKHVKQWRSTLTLYCKPFWNKPVDAVTTNDVVGVLKDPWRRVPETGSRLRGRIEKVLDAAKARGFRSGENPATWRGHLDNLLPKRQRLTRGHHRALPYDQVPALNVRLKGLGSMSALCLEFTILTAARSGEAMGASWDEFDLEKGVWTVPKERMKSGREHRVPLSRRALEIIRALEGHRQSALVFPGQKVGRPLSPMALEMLLRRLKVDATVHGFRSSFRDWAAERSSAPREVAEAALAHVLENRVEAAYRRSDLFEKRRVLMQHWQDHCDDLRPAE